MYPHVKFTGVIERRALHHWRRLCYPLAALSVMAGLVYAPTSTGAKWESVEKIQFNTFLLCVGIVLRLIVNCGSSSGSGSGGSSVKPSLPYATLDDSYTLGVLYIMATPMLGMYYTYLYVWVSTAVCMYACVHAFSIALRHISLTTTTPP